MPFVPRKNNQKPKERKHMKHEKTYATLKDENGDLVNAWIYGEFIHREDLWANYHIQDLGEGNDGGRYMLTIENDGWLDDDLAKLEGILFEWMENV